MTFIASVIAKDGIAIIADSLVSTIDMAINQNDWNEFLNRKKKGSGTGNIQLTEEEITNLFSSKPSHTKDYENKLFNYDNYTAITTAGGAEINGKRIEYLVNDIKQKTQVNVKGYSDKTIEEKIEEFKNHLLNDINEHLEKYNRITNTIFIISNYNKNDKKSSIYKVIVNACNKSNANEEGFEAITTTRESMSVVCDGQDGIANRILYGGIFDSLKTHRKIIKSTELELAKLDIKEGNKLPAGFFRDLSNKQAGEIVVSEATDAQLFNLNSLSLQQASDLAYLLLKVERDLQAYTKDIPTVGGVVKLAIINEEGFKFVLGQTIIKPTRHL